MNKITRSKIKLVVAIGLFTILCGWALTPIWLYPCVPSRLSEEEIKQFRDQYGSEYITLEKQAKNDQRRREQEIPCGAEDLPTREKLEASRFQAMLLGELRSLRYITLRVEFIGMVEN